MAREIEIKLGGESYTVSQLPMRANKAWRDNLAAPFSRITALLEGNQELELATVGDYVSIIQLVSDVALGAIDIIAELVFDYAPVLAKDRARIESEAYDDEMVEAFGQILGLAYPLGRLASVIGIGRSQTTTSPNSPSPSGVNGQTKSGRPKKSKTSS